MCPACNQPIQACRCRAATSTPAWDGIVRVGRQTKGRRGKGVPLAGKELQALAKDLKQRCGSGGTVPDGVIEIRGDHRDALVVELERHGWTARHSAG